MSGVIEPDTKDWTWVLERACPECGLDVSSLDPDRIPPLLRQNAVQWARLLAGPSEVVRGRTQSERWSILEYACHVRDVFILFDQRLQLMLASDDPLFANWDQDETAVAERYDQQDPTEVSAQLAEAAEALARSFESVEPAQQSRSGRRSDGAVFTVATFGRYMIHDPLHHLFDVGEQPSL
jgi:Mycothiol maleylpyruvate isomerase N-terminal domain